MLNDISDLEPLIQATSLTLNLSEFAIEKDFYVTQAIQTLTKIDDDYFALVFQGGTSLAKGYQLIQRLSEDVDFRIIQKPLAKQLGSYARRKRLRAFRYTLIQALKDAHFNVSDEAVRVFYEGRFMRIQAKFPESDKASYLKPYIAIECFLGEQAMPSNLKNISSLIKLTLEDRCHHPMFPVHCVALDETAAEKWVALTRRVAGTQIKKRKSDQHLVRHLYDLYHLHFSGLLTGHYCELVKDIIQRDKTQFKKQNPNYVRDPIHTSALALEALHNDKQWRNFWDIFLEQMVYEIEKPSFDKAYAQLQLLSQEIFQALGFKG